jgi:uroporphyrin-III C-methyltransferase
MSADMTLTGTRVWLVGAGPGDPELLTMKAARLLAQAEIVLHDALVSPAILALAPQARLVDVGKRSGRASAAQRFINRVLVTSARRCSRVVRLKGGDPTIFGRLDEEMQALRAAGIAFEVVPGVTAACAAAAAIPVSLTLRGVARSVSFVTPLRAGGAVDAGELERLAADDGSLIVYMAGAQIAAAAQGLISQGRAADTPLLIVESASLPQQSVWRGTLATAVSAPGGQGGPVLLMIGAAFGALSTEAVSDDTQPAPLALAA